MKSNREQDISENPGTLTTVFHREPETHESGSGVLQVTLSAQLTEARVVHGCGFYSKT